MNSSIGNNEITRGYYELSLEEKRLELYSEFCELMLAMQTITKNKYPDIELRSINELDNLKNYDLDEDEYMTGLYEDLIVFKELFAYYFDDSQE